MSPSKFRPALWMPGPHAQTILPSLLPAVGVRGAVEAIDVPVASQTWVRMILSLPSGAPRGTVLAIHGLSGSAESGYMRRTASQALARGWAVARLNLRTCGGTEALAATLYNAGQSEDAGAALSALADRGLPRPYALIGFSLGGNIAMRYAGLTGDACLADAVVGVNPPVDLNACIDALERSGNALYHAYFTRNLCAHLRRMRRLREIPGPDARRGAIRGVREFDDVFTAPDAGYAGAAEYYRRASAGPVLSGLKRPSMILSAQDDPLVPVSMFAAYHAASKHLRFLHPRSGGHCGYWGADAPRFWAATTALSFFEGDRERVD